MKSRIKHHIAKITIEKIFYTSMNIVIALCVMIAYGAMCGWGAEVGEQIFTFKEAMFRVIVSLSIALVTFLIKRFIHYINLERSFD